MFIRQLGYIIALSRERHFGRAAEACNVSQPALSGAIRSIESELGMSIVRRGRRFEGFTPDGERVLAWARRVLADCEGLRQEALAGSTGPSGVLRLGAIPTTLPLVPLMTDGCLERYPNMRHQVRTLPAAEVCRRVADFELDAGLIYLGTELPHGVVARPMFRERYVLIGRDDRRLRGGRPMEWAAAAKLPLCLLTRDMQCRRGIDVAFARAGAEVTPRVETDSLMALYAHVRCAGLYSVVPHSALSMTEMRDELTAVPLVPELHREIGLVLLQREPRPPVVEAALSVFHEGDLQARVDALLGV